MNLQKRKRKRGVVLTHEGYRKLQGARLESEIQENQGETYTLEELSDRTGLDHGTIRKVLEQEEGVDRRTLERFFTGFGLALDKGDYSKPASLANEVKSQDVAAYKHNNFDPEVDITVFYGRTNELIKLRQWLLLDRCRLVAILGIGGIGKTSLAVKLTAQIKDHFEYVVWQSLQDAPPVQAVLSDLIQLLSGTGTDSELLRSLGENISRLIERLRTHRCLLIFDNVETILCSGRRAGEYREGCEGYGELLRRIGEATHQSCLLLTSREKPKEIASQEGEGLAVRSLRLDGLNQTEGQELFRVKGLSGSEAEIKALVEYYAGNTLALKIVATTIQDVFDGKIAEFLKHETTVFGDIRHLLDQQFDRLTELEKDIMYWLAINREPVSLSQLQSDIVSPIPSKRLLEALESLGRRSLLEKHAMLFTLQPVVMEYVTNRIIERVCEEITTQHLDLFRCHALMKATAKDYIREIQIRLILQPLIDELITALRSIKRIEDHLIQILNNLRESSPLESAYAAGNVINLLCRMEVNLTNYDFSHLTIWQADFRNVRLQNVNFAYASFDKSAFAETFGGVLSLAFSPDGRKLAMGDTNGEIRIYQLVNDQLILICKGHANWVVSLTFNPDGTTLASSSTDHTVKLWDISTGQCLQTLYGHEDEVWSVAFNSNGETLASASDDQTIKLWNVRTGECLQTLQGHTSWVCSVTFSTDGLSLISGSDDHTIRMWDINTGKCFKLLQGHQDGIRSVAVSSCGQMLASCSEDQTVKLWRVETGECIRTFYGHSSDVYSVTFSPQGDFLASGSFDRTARLWSVSTGECLKVLQGHSSWVFSLDFSSQGDLLASGSYDQTIRLWNVNTGQCVRTFQGYTNQIASVAFNTTGQMLVSGSHDRSIRLWDIHTGQCLKAFQGHRAAIQSIAFSSNERMVASGSHDCSVRLWDIHTGQCLKIFQGHQAAVWSVDFSPDGQTLASSGHDCSVRLWDIHTGQCLKIFQGHCAAVWSIDFSPKGKILASGALDNTIKLWNVSTGRCEKTLEGHTTWVWCITFSQDGEMLASTSADGTLRLWRTHSGNCIKILQSGAAWLSSVAFSPDNQILATGSHDHTVKLWDVNTGQCIKSLQGHTGGIWSVVFNSDSRVLASSSDDETIRLWDIENDKCLAVLKAEQLYERMDVMGVTGLTTATITTLQSLGAIV